VTDCRCFSEERATATKYRKIWGAESGQKTTKIYEGVEQIKVELLRVAGVFLKKERQRRSAVKYGARRAVIKQRKYTNIPERFELKS
jgi:hypothetical protein